MKLTKILGVAGAAALALMAFASTASATTLEINGVKQTGVVAIEASLKPGTSILVSDTFGFFANTCTTSVIKGSTSSIATGQTDTGPITTLSFGTIATPCKEGNPTVHKKGNLSIEWISGTNGTLRSEGAEWTVPSALGTLTCKTPTEGGTDLGTLTGVASGSATMDINAVFSCGIDAKWTATYLVTSPGGLGVVN